MEILQAKLRRNIPREEKVRRDKKKFICLQFTNQNELKLLTRCQDSINHCWNKCTQYAWEIRKYFVTKKKLDSILKKCILEQWKWPKLKPLHIKLSKQVYFNIQILPIIK